MDAFYVAFFNRYPFLSGGLYLTGESYAGKYIPAFGTAIHNNNLGREFQVPLLGMAIGDGWTEPSQQSQAYIPQARALALIDENQAAAAQVQADLCSAAIAKGDFAGALTPCNAVMGVITAAAGSTLDMYAVCQLLFSAILSSRLTQMCWIQV
jgi:carboxypeptidase C (cathepsin A)